MSDMEDGWADAVIVAQVREIFAILMNAETIVLGFPLVRIARLTHLERPSHDGRTDVECMADKRCLLESVVHHQPHCLTGIC